MPSAPARAPSNAQPALRIPTFDSMKRFSTATDFSDMPDFDFTKTMDQDSLMLPNYILEHISTGQEANINGLSCNYGDGTSAGKGLKVDFGSNGSRDRSNDTTGSISNGDVEGRNPPISLEALPIPARNSSRVPFNPSRPVSQITTNDGITALPTLASRGLLFSNQDLGNNDSPMLPTSRKRKASSALSGSIKRLRNLSLDTFTSKRHKRRGSSLSCMNDAGTTVGNEKKVYGTPNAKVNTPFPSPSSATPSTPTTFGTPTPTTRCTNTLATTIIPTYPPSSPIQAPHASSPGQLLLPDDLTCLTALQEVISNLHAENETLKQQVKMLREDWYATHDELLVERYEGWEKECALEKLRNSSETTKNEDGRIEACKKSNKSGSKEGGDGVSGDEMRAVKKEHNDEEISGQTARRGLYEFKYMVGVGW